MSEAFETLGNLRHHCTSCGQCCGGLFVRLRNQDEVERVRAFAAEMGRPDPIDGMHLRHDPTTGMCCFLGPDLLCDIHRRYGGEAKPWICQQYPIVVLRTENETRLDLDPGCIAHILSWRSGEILRCASPLGTQRVPSPEESRAEAAWLEAMEMPGTTIANLLTVACENRLDGGPHLPAGFDRRLVSRLRKAEPELRAWYADPSVGFGLRGALAPIFDAFGTWDPESPPPWPVLAPEEDAFAIDCVKRLIYLRLTMGSIPVVAGAVLLGLSGAVVAGWATQEREAYGAALAAWMRVVRSRNFWTLITPDSETMAWLATG